MCFGDYLPYSLNTMRFLGYSGTMNYQSDQWLIPSFSIFGQHTTYFNVSEAGFIRVYTEPHQIDVDIKLLGNGLWLTSGSNAINTEESFIWPVVPGTQYAIEYRFYNFLGIDASCATFNMEIEIGPAPTRAAVCPNGGSIPYK